MIKLGQKVRVIKRPNNSESGRNAKTEKQGYIYTLTKHLITVMYTKDGHDTHRESINIGDITDKYIELQVEINKKWKVVTRKDFEELMKNE